MNSAKRFVYLVVCIGLVSPALSAGLLKKEQGYDKPIYYEGLTPRTYVDSDFMFLVPESSRHAALKTLSGKRVLGITETLSTDLLGEKIDTSELLDVLGKKIDENVQRRQKSLERKAQPEASFWDFLGKSDDLRKREVEQEYIRLDQLHAEHIRALKGRLMPYLVSIEASPAVNHNVSGWIENDLLPVYEPRGSRIFG